MGLSALTCENAKDTSTLLEEELTCSNFTDPDEPSRVPGEKLSLMSTVDLPKKRRLSFDLSYRKVTWSPCEHTSAGGTF